MNGSEMNDIYGRMALHDIPWNIEAPPAELVALVEGGKVAPCKVVDLGCGAGNYSRYLAGKGFVVTGLDISTEAIRIAKSMVEAEILDCWFISADLSEDLPVDFPCGFDFAFEWEVLHHILPDKREKYIRNVNSLLNSGARYLAVCFHENNLAFERSGKYFTTRLGTRLYFSNEEELRELYSLYFEILELKAISINSKIGRHLINYTMLEKT